MLAQALQQNVEAPKKELVRRKKENHHYVLYGKNDHYLSTNTKVNSGSLSVLISCLQHLYPPKTTSCRILLTR